MNKSMYKQKKKRAVNPNIVRPNLFSHEKTIKEQAQTLGEMSHRTDTLSRTIEAQNTRIHNLETTVSQLLEVLRRRG